MNTPFFDPSRFVGLDESEAQRRLISEGFNELPSSRNRSILAIAWDVLREPMLLLLVACGVIYLLLGDKQEAILLLASIIFVIGITLYQERKTERALEALRDLSSPRARVIRGGEQRRIPGRDVVRGDIVLLSEGDRIPADGNLLACAHLSVDESLLTGESVPVRKAPWDGTIVPGQPGGDDLPSVYSGTLVVQGRGVCQVEYTGIRTEMGKIGLSLEQLPNEQTRIHKETYRLMRALFILGAGVALAVFVLYGLRSHDWLQALLASLTVSISMLPEEFAVVLTIFLALGAWRISKQGVLTRHVPAVEMLGAATVLCADKTGTLTVNRMAVERIVTVQGSSVNIGEKPQSFPEEFHAILEYAILASQKDPFDPMEKAFGEAGERLLHGTEHLHADWTVVREYPLSRELLAMSEVWMSPNLSDFVIAAKGAPESIVDLCHLDAAAVASIEKLVEQMTTDGLRVLGVAAAKFAGKELPEQQHDFSFHFIGLVGLADPIRPTVPAAVAECRTAGIRVVMITGDHPNTARAIAREVGLNTERMITGPELSALSDEALKKCIGGIDVFARVVPEQKLRIVQALKARGDIVAMTGDGVNDAPALKAADIGIAMGGRGTDVAREAADLVLLDDDFSSMVRAVRVGRRIYDNLRKAMSYIVAVHLPIAGLSLLPIIFNWPLILTPVHIVFLELIIDPACSVVFEMEPEEKNIMQRPPHDPSQPMFGRRRLIVSILQGLSVTAVTLLVCAISLLNGMSAETARTITFTTLIVANIGLILTNRSWTRTIIGTLWTPNSSLVWVAGGALLFLGAAIFIPFLQRIFQFAPLSAAELLFAFVAGSISILWFECVKLLPKYIRIIPRSGV